MTPLEQVGLLAFAAFFASVLTTVMSLVQLQRKLSARVLKLASLRPTRIVRGTAKVAITEVAHAVEGDRVEVGVLSVSAKTRRLRLEGAEAYGARIWTELRAPFALGGARRATRARTVDLCGSPNLFVATGSETILATYDPRKEAARSLLFARIALLLVLESAATAATLLFSHPMESSVAKIGALLALAHFLVAPLLERAVRISARDPDEAGARFLMEAR